MNLRKSIKLLISGAMFSAVLVSGVSTASASSPVILGYYTPDQASDNSLTTNYSYITHVSTDSFNFNSEGNIVGTIPTTAIAFTKSKNITTYACISNYGPNDFDADLAHTILTNPTIRNKAMANLIALVKNNGYKGVNFDFEAVPNTDRAALTSFMRELATSMHSLGLQALISVPAKTVEDPNDDWGGAFDYPVLGQLVDYVQVMTYDEHGIWASPGPVAGKDWMEESLQYAVSAVPPAKVLMGLPAYGYDWNLTTNNASDGKQVPWREIPALISKTKAAVKWDTASSSPYFNYQASDGSKHVVWYENERSITEKSGYYAKYHLGGISVWAIGLDDTSFWKALATNTPAPDGAAIPGKIEAESFTAMQGVVKETTTDTGGGMNVGYIDAGDWMDYKVNVQTAGSYSVGLRVASPVAGGQFQIKNASGTVLASVTIPKTGGYQTWQTVNTTITLPAGSQTLRVNLVKGEPNLNWLNFVKTP
ncbi:glycosyl hydrolase family 18 protein [Paenibacillus sp. HWE-109]|uniref:glycosyl hydrolase family 18 protein n=1 Tax=Paenibacillus sp. HWE-109 TaxID=1306526 RepID=UPI001EDF658B|nr:glycosyl hydrolase family 18 protein [Paenibacillus sp. HWE-109]UKS27605.1 glycosyl hydrolase family 18 protein [Paenibacillus sp. HWE-109]